MYDGLRKTFWNISKAVLPVVAIVLVLQFTVLGMPAFLVWRFLLGALLVTAGLVLFLFGVKVAILPMGEAIGNVLPQIGKLGVILFWAFLLGFTATLAEPPVRVLAGYIEYASEGEIGGNFLIIITALGIGLFISLAILRIVLQIPLHYIFLGGYVIILVLSYFIPPEFVAISFDASGVTTGPVTVPVILSLGLGITAVLGGKSRVGEGFGLVGIASIGPILLVMLLGVMVG